jgi:mono/diheme cytochrome c family protein
VIAAIWENDLRHFLILLNLVALAALIGYLLWAVLSPKRVREEEHPAANVTPFFKDEDLEGRRLERVQGWALIFAAVIAVALPLYWLREPTRQDQTDTYFNKNSVSRGQVLYAGPASEGYNAAVSKQCANCHGNEGEGGVAPFRINGEPVNWKAPALNTEALRFTEEPACADPSIRQPTTVCEISDIITYGRPGTPMQGWGVAGGGPLNDQGVADLVAYIKSFQLTPEEAKQQATDALTVATDPDPDAGATCPAYASCAAIELNNAQSALDQAEELLASERRNVREVLELPNAADAELTTRCQALADQVKDNPTNVPADVKEQATACGEYREAAEAAADAEAALAWSQDWLERRGDLSDGQVLFEMYCARCHTDGWSVFDPAAPEDDPDVIDNVGILGLPGGGGGQGGGIGFNLRDGDTIRRFGTDEEGGWQAQVDFVSEGSNPNQEYGYRGIGSGRMPGFGQMLTPEQIGAIVSYERYCLEATSFTSASEPCETPPEPRTPPTSTSIALPAAEEAD